MWDSRLAISCALRGLGASALSFAVACAADLLVLIVLRQFVEGEAVFTVLLIGLILFGLTAVGALIFGVYVGARRYRKLQRARLASFSN